jgi:electron transfer flavoprotein alpha subunit
MPGAIWVLAEQWRGKVSEITFEALALGKELATAAEARLEVVLLGHEVRGLAAELGLADRVLLLDDAALAEPVPACWANALAPLVEARTPRAVLVPLTNVSLGAGSLVAAKLGLPAVNLCRDVRLEGADLIVRSELYGGKIEAEVRLGGPTALLGIWPGTRQAEKGRVSRVVEVEEVAATGVAEPRVRLKRYIEPEVGDVDIREQEILVAVGRGMQSRDNLALAEELAAALGGAVCGSRPVIDQGWLPLSRQVGKSGQTVKPRLYLALGISGAPEHVEGMRDAALIVAVNTDAEAPIFRVAHYGIVADALELLPGLTEAVLVKKGHAAHA